MVVFFLMRDTPQSCGLPPIEEYQNDYPPDYSAEHERTFSFREIFFGYVLNNRSLWAIAVANAFVYFVRYGVVNWIPTYLETAKGFSFKQSSIAWSLYEFAAIPGTIVCGWMSDKRLQGPARAGDDPLHGADAARAWSSTGSNLQGPLWIDYAALIAIGFLIYGPIMIIGLHALDLVPEEGRRHRRRVHRLLRLRLRLRDRGHRRRLDRRPLGLERRVHHDGGVLRADDRLQRPHARRQTDGERGPRARSGRNDRS